MKDFRISVSYRIGNAEYTSGINSDHYTLDVMRGAQTLKVILHPKTILSNVVVNVSCAYSFDNNSRFYSNGYQSWSYSEELKRQDEMNHTATLLTPIVKAAGGYYVGDDSIVKDIPNIYTQGIFHSFSHCYIRALNRNIIDMFGSLNDRTGYTIFIADMNEDTLTITKDLQGVSISERYEVMNIVELEGEYDTVWDKYFRMLEISPPLHADLKGYTSWYNYKGKISQNIILKDLEAISVVSPESSLFQIDDGYQTTVGDPLSIDYTKFPEGMKFIADKIHERKMLAGLWLCPFGATKKSSVFLKHRDWLVRDKLGLPIKVGAAWGGFYAIDIYNPDAREYVAHILKTVTKEWGYDLLKLDFLYAECAIPRNNKSRAEIMYDTIDFIRECVGDTLILACGAPLMPCFGKVDYCRIGCDINYSWKNLLDYQISKEYVSTRKSLNNTMFRRYLNRRAFINDPDAFIMREVNTYLKLTQKRLIARINAMFAGMMLTSDTVGNYAPETLREYQNALALTKNKYDILGVNKIYKNFIRIDYLKDGIAKILVFDLANGEIKRDN